MPGIPHVYIPFMSRVARTLTSVVDNTPEGHMILVTSSVLVVVLSVALVLEAVSVKQMFKLLVHISKNTS